MQFQNEINMRFQNYYNSTWLNFNLKKIQFQESFFYKKFLFSFYHRTLLWAINCSLQFPFTPFSNKQTMNLNWLGGVKCGDKCTPVISFAQSLTTLLSPFLSMNQCYYWIVLYCCQICALVLLLFSMWITLVMR